MRWKLFIYLFPFFLISLVFASSPPFLNFDEGSFGRKLVNPKPRPYHGRSNITPQTSLYFEVLVPDSNTKLGQIDPDTITATLLPADGGDPIPMLQAGQQFAPGYTGQIIHNIDRGENNGEAIYILPEDPLDFDRTYTVEVYAETYDGVPIDPNKDSWSFTTRPEILDHVLSWNIDLAGSTVTWNGWFFTGILKPNFNTSRLFDQLDSYDLMDTVTAINPYAWSLQRDWPLTSDYWHNCVFDGNPNLVRERETRQIIEIRDQGQKTLLTVTDLEEGPLYGIPPGRPLSEDYFPGDLVTIADREKYEVTEVISVDDSKSIVKVSKLLIPPSRWILDYEGSHPADHPETPDNFSYPLCYLRKFEPPGTPVYYWSRVDDEWDIVHGQHGRRLQVNFSYTPLDLSQEPVPAHHCGHGSISPPKDYLQWHNFVRDLTFHLIDRYGTATLDFYWSIGNEHNYGVFWSGTKDEFYEFYDYIVNALLTAFEDRGLDTNKVQVGGVEAGGLGGVNWIRDALYHMSGAANKPESDIAEQNFVCANPEFDNKRAMRVAALCEAYNGKGSPIDFVSIHEYGHADQAIADLTAIRDDALAMDPTYYEDLNVTSFESTPDWQPRDDPAAAAIYLGNGFFPAWCADWMHRLVEKAETDPRYARHEAVLTVWPFDYNAQGVTSVTGLMRVDDDGDGTEDRISTIRKAVFNYIELLAHMNNNVEGLLAQKVAGIRLAGVRSASPTSHTIMLYAHDKEDTESRDETVFTIHLFLESIPWSFSTVRRWRVDKDHSSPYRAYQALPKKDLYSPEELVELETSDELVLDGLPLDYDTSSGTLELQVPLSVNGVTFLEMTERDVDNDGWTDSMDNCPEDYNPDQENNDGDEAGDICDCAPDDPSAFSIPSEIQNVRFLSDKSTIEWDSDAPYSGNGTVYDTMRGKLSEFPVGSGPSEICIESGSTDTRSEDSSIPLPGNGSYYLVRGRNHCGTGTYGADSSDLERSTLACP